MDEKPNRINFYPKIYPNLEENLHQLVSEKESSTEFSNKSEISESPPGYSEIFGTYIRLGLNYLA